ncbi:MAG: hypothetical protein LBC63_10315 [Holophagales bacterium]|jgi:hypothetical protein|nr:hypothetical protein [Holophagales bacterium]
MRTIIPLLMPQLIGGLYAQTSAPEPILRPCEGLAVIGRAGEIKTWGEVASLSPMGNLAKILWLRLEADEWDSMGLETKCKGELNGIHCDKPKGHGKVDVAKSFKEDCNVAFSIWTNISLDRWKRDYGESGARQRMVEVFGPFLGNRLPKEPTLPASFGAEWFAGGQLIQTSPAMLAQWLAKPAQERLLAACRNYVLGFANFVLEKNDKWWIKISEAPVLEVNEGMDNGGQKQYWVIGGNGGLNATTAILRINLAPANMTKKDAEARFKAIMNIKK